MWLYLVTDLQTSVVSKWQALFSDLKTAFICTNKISPRVAQAAFRSLRYPSWRSMQNSLCHYSEYPCLISSFYRRCGMMLGSVQAVVLEGVWCKCTPINYCLYLLNNHLCFPSYVLIASFSLIIKKSIKLL